MQHHDHRAAAAVEPAFRNRWSSLQVAQLRYDAASRRWPQFSFGSDDRWRPYGLASPAPEFAPLLVAIEEDRTDIFWG